MNATLSFWGVGGEEKKRGKKKHTKIKNCKKSRAVAGSISNALNFDRITQAENLIKRNNCLKKKKRQAPKGITFTKPYGTKLTQM